MINISAFIHSLKLTWIRRILLTQHKWSKIIEENLDIKYIWQFGNAYTEKQRGKVTNLFWKDVLESYGNLMKRNNPSNKENILTTPMFYNDLLKIDEKPIFLKHWCGRGIFLINDIIKYNGHFYSENEIKEIFKIQTNFIEYHSLITVIKKFLKTANYNLNKEKLHGPILPNHVSIILKSKKGTKDFYDIFNQNKEVPTSKIRWEKLYEIPDEKWTQIFMSPFQSSNSTALQWFQIRINHFILPTKRYLFKIKASQSPLCQSCKEEENIIHMLWSCPETQTFLQQIQDYLHTHNIRCSFEEIPFIFNTESDITFKLKLKHYIFVTKFHNKPLSLVAALNTIQYFYKPLKYLAQISNKNEKFRLQWEKFQNILET